mmetsp:Transcript_5083/g.11089  ORF Transcript_5083/g.11089 Transcript_5083/m.11089 type:complete len:302 (-) Transcript_5083:434-1339(-)
MGVHGIAAGTIMAKTEVIIMMMMGSSMRSAFFGTILLRLNLAIFKLRMVNIEPNTPPITPQTMAGISASTFIDTFAFSSKMMATSLEKVPINVLFSETDAMRELKKSAVNTLIMHAKKICQESFWFQKDATSSKQKRRPPTGAPKAAATPAATPAVMKSRLSRRFLNLFMMGKAQPSVFDLICDTPAPIMAPMWIMGPSGPTGMPEPTAVAQLKNLITSVLKLSVFGMCTPFKKPITSGMPDPAAAGAMKTTIRVLKRTKTREYPTDTPHAMPIPGPSEKDLFSMKGLTRVYLPLKLHSMA